jgi:nicotinamidase-related amidase
LARRKRPDRLGRLTRQSAVLVVCDVQERLLPAILGSERLLHNCTVMAQAARTMGLPIIVTEQYPKGLGPTVAPLRETLGDSYQPVEKTSFSCCGAKRFVGALEHYGVSDVIVVGMEAHVCVLQTVLDALDRGYAVHVPRDAVGSRTEANWQVGVERMRDAGAFIGSLESILFQLLRTSEVECFKAVQGLIK